MSKLPGTTYVIPDVENTIREADSKPVYARVDHSSKDDSAKTHHDLPTIIENVGGKVQRNGKAKAVRTSKLKKPKAATVDGVSAAQKVPAPKQNASPANRSQPKKTAVGKAATSVAKKPSAKATAAKKSKTTESDKKPPVKKPLAKKSPAPSGGPDAKPKTQVKKATPVLRNLISAAQKLEAEKDKPKKILKSAQKSGVKRKAPKQSDGGEGAKPSDDNQRATKVKRLLKRKPALSTSGKTAKPKTTNNSANNVPTQNIKAPVN